MADQQHRLGKVQQQISSGRKWQDRSEAPADAAETRTLLRQQNDQKQWQSNVGAASHWTKATEARLQGLTDNIQRIHELGVQTINGPHTKAERKVVAKEVNEMLESLVTKAESKFQGNYLFSGTRSDVSPIDVTRNADGKITAVKANFSNDIDSMDNWQQREVQVNKATERKYGALAGGNKGVFMDTGHNPADGDLEPGSSIFDAAIKLRDTLEAGDVPDESLVGDIQKGLERATHAMVENGVNSSTFEDIEKRFQEIEASSNETIDEIRNTDVAQASVRLSELQSSLQATMRMTVNSQQLSLSNYL